VSLDEDIRSAQIAFAAYAKAASRILRKPKNIEIANAHAFHEARAFVTACRRVGRLLETVNVSIFPPPVAAAVKLQRSAKKQFFREFVAMRDVSEHIAEKVKSPAQFLLNGIMVVDTQAKLLHPLIVSMNISESHLTVPNLASAPITHGALETVIACRDAICDAVCVQFPRRTKEVFKVLPADVAGYSS
jgi:hypothetical protein